jgi:hypothetical protein
MRHTAILLASLSLGACSLFSKNDATEALPSLEPSAVTDSSVPPDAQNLVTGIKQGITDSHFKPPIEVTDLLKAPMNSANFWIVCVRSAQSDETKRITYSVFFKDKYIQSRYSVYTDGCGGQQFHPFVEPPPIPPPSSVPAKKKRQTTSKSAD